MPRTRVAVVDLTFCWPPRGGAGLDLVETWKRLRHEFPMRLFVPDLPDVFGRGWHAAEPPPLPATLVPTAAPTREAVVGALLAAVRRWRPDLVFVGDGWTLKPYVVNALREHFPVILRLYAHEMLCPRNNEAYPHTHACGTDLLATPQRCLACAADYAGIVRAHRQGAVNPLIAEAELADIHRGDYPAAVRAALEGSTVIVYNRDHAARLAMLGVRAHVVPGGIDPAEFADPLPPPPPGGPLRLLAAGRMDDPAKGADVAVAAVELLHERGVDCRLTVTRQPRLARPWLRECGWLDRAGLRRELAAADVVLVPSRWPEAFGMAWTEALAAGRPVVASAVAGPRQYLRHNVDGLLVPADDPEALAATVHALRDPARRAALAAAGRRRVRRAFSWEAVAGRVAALIRRTAAP